MSDKIYFMLLKIPHIKTRIYLSDLWNDLSSMFEYIGDDWWEYRFKRLMHTKHKFSYKKEACKCGKKDPRL